MITKICEGCKKEYLVHDYRSDIAKYCSRKCKWIGHSMEIKCDSCGIIFRKIKSTLREHNYCSTECMHSDPEFRKFLGKKITSSEKYWEGIRNNKRVYEKGVHWSPDTEFKNGEAHPMWKGGTGKKRGEDWIVQREKALERDDYTCQRCGEEAEHVHHIVPYIISQDNNLDNLISFCRRCHIIHENGYSKLIREGEDIIITNVPKKTLDRFNELSNSIDFGGESSFLLKWLVDLHDGLMLTGMETVMAEIESLRQEIIQLKSGLLTAKQENPKEKILRMISGRTIKIRTGGTDENGNTK